MTPTKYVEKVPRYTAVQWDGEQDSVTWITDNLAGSTFIGEDMIVRDSLDREQKLDRGAWVVLNEATGEVLTVDENEFSLRYELVE